jgi:putative peptidoglycan lipid II flippase
MRIIRNVITVGGFTALSRVFGLVREMLIAHFLGASLVTDAFFVAFKFPNFFRRIFGEGAFNASFVPLFSQKLVTEGKGGAYHFAERVFSVMLCFLAIFVLLVVIFTPSIIHLMAPGFVTTPERMELAITFTRITFPYILFISLAAHLSGVLNSLDRFAAAAGVPILLNIIMIGSLLLAPQLELSHGVSLSWAVALAGVVQLAWLYGVCWKMGFRIRLYWPSMTPEIRSLLKLMIPGAVGAGMMNINFFIEMIIASYLPENAISYLTYADRLNQLPLAMFGIAIGTALLPVLSRQLKAGDFEQAQNNKLLATEIALQLTIPAAFGLAILSHPIIQLFYGHGLSEGSIQATASALMAFSLGIPAYVLNKIFVTGFFARQDTKTPVVVSGFCIGLNILMSLALISVFSHVALALSMTLSAWVNTIVLYVLLKKKNWFHLTHTFMKRIAVVTLNAALMAGFLWKVNGYFYGLPRSLMTNIIHIAVSVGFGVLLCGGLGILLKSIDVPQLKKVFRGRT